MAQESMIVYEKDAAAKMVRITLNRPEKLNALKRQDWHELRDAVIQAEEDDDVKVVIFRGAGRAFCSGHDVGELGVMHGYGTGGPSERRPSQRARLLVDRNSFWGRRGVYQTIFNCMKATIAQVHGYCFGGGVEIAIACDITVAAEDTLFTHPGWRYIGPTGELALWIATIGVKKTKEMMLTGIPIDAQEALRVGLVNKVVPMEKLEEETNKIADTIACMPFDGIVMGKAHFEAALDALGVGPGYTVGYLMHSLQTNIRYEPDEFNLFRERRNKGVKAAIREREAHYATTP